MIEVNEAVKIIQNSVLNFPKTKVPLDQALGKVLRQPIIADADFPPFNRVMMDGIAIKSKDFEKGIKCFKIHGIQAAGSPQMNLAGHGYCLEVMTGAVAPSGTDMVIRYEDVKMDYKKQEATILINKIEHGKNIHPKGADKRKGDVLVKEGVLIGTPEIAVGASVGLSEIWVTKNPSVAIVSTGNELVDIGATPLPHQIRRSNVHSLAAEMQKMGIQANLFHLYDQKELLQKELKKILDSHDVIMLSGGVSKGKFDFVPKVLDVLGVEKLFHTIKQKPGKPFWFGRKEGRKVVFAFPGNPVSTFLCFHKYMIPWLNKCLGIQDASPLRAVLATDFSIKTDFTYFLQVEVKVDAYGRIVATPKIGRGSGDHANLLSSDAFLELPGGQGVFKKGEAFPLIPFRQI